MNLLIIILSFLSAQLTLANENICATIYSAHSHHHAMEDHPHLYKEINAQESFNDLEVVQIDAHHGNWDNKIGHIEVKKGCSLVTYQYKNFGIDYHSGNSMGFTAIFENNASMPQKSFHLINSEYNQKISSLKCFCL